MAKKDKLEIPAEQTKPESVTADELVAKVELPTPNPRTIEAISGDLEKQNATENSPAASDPVSSVATSSEKPGLSDSGIAPGTLDDNGRKFNPEKHLPEKDGKGSWKYKSANKGKVTGASEPRKIDSQVGQMELPGTSQIPALPPGEDKFSVAADSFLTLFYYTTDAVLAGNSGEWQPQTENERKTMKDALALYLRTNNILDLPPGWALLLTVTVFSIPRLSAPKTKEKITEWREKITNFVSKKQNAVSEKIVT